MRALNRMMWATVGVGACGVIVGIGLMMAGDWLGRRDEAALRVAVSAPLQAQSATAARDMSAAPPMTSGLVEQEFLPPLRLVGTMLADDPRNSTALFEDIERRTRTTMRRGERIGSWELTTIERAWVFFLASDQSDPIRLELEGPTLRDVAALRRGSMSQLLAKFQALPEAAAPPEEAAARASEAITVVSDDARIVDRQQVLDAFQGNALQVLSQSPVVPEIRGDQAGLRVARLADSPWTAKVGLRAGDLVTAINGKPVLDPTKIGEVVRDLYAAPMLDFTIQRDGREMTLHYLMESAAQGVPVAGSP